MSRLKNILYWILSILTVIIVLGSVLSVFRDTDNRFLKMLDFARIQFFLASLVVLPLFVLTTDKWRWYDKALVVGLFSGLFINGFYLANYTPLVSPAVPAAVSQEEASSNFQLYIANVKMKNRNAELLLDQLKSENPDLIILMEIDSWWDEQLNALIENYPYQKEVINEVAYGMGLYSKLPLSEINVEYLQNENVPMINAVVTIANGNKVKLFSTHPVPPTRYKNLPDNAGQSEVAFAKIGKMVQQSSYPTIVAGDFNDVVWAYTDALTHTEGLLRDVRTGRGFYNSFDAQKWYMRYPLDHVLVTDQFSLVELKRLPSIDSDHFPIAVRLAL